MSEAKETKLYTLPGKSAIDKLKEKYGKVFHISTEGGERNCLIRKPTFVDIQRATASEKKKAGTFNQSILENCWLEGDSEIKTNDDYLFQVLAEMENVIQIREATTKEL
jgi:hypothetical protein